jgi:DNA-binding cell septation regulator SpoVG
VWHACGTRLDDDRRSREEGPAISGLKVSEVKMRFHEGDDVLLGWASCVVNDALYLNNIAIVRGEDGGLKLHYPSTRSQSDQRHFHFNPITRQAQRTFDKAILGILGRGRS